jgi:methylmalonyl-CoA mutase cobalamin-binding domain/chain
MNFINKGRIIKKGNGETGSLSQAIVNLQINEISSLVEDELGTGRDPYDILRELREGMEEVGKKFENSEYFLADLIMAGETMKKALDVLKPMLKERKAEYEGRIVIGTIWGDLHDIGKDIVISLLTSAGFDVYDLGIDVPPRRFAEEAERVGAKIVAISALLSTSIPTISKVVEELRKIGIRDKVRIIAGGAALRREYAKWLGIDAAVNDAMEGLEIIKSWVSKYDP